MIGRISRGRHVAVGLAIAVTTVLAGLGVIGGGGPYPERFDAKTVVVERDGDTLRISEFVDIDFGSEDRRGYQRVIPHDFGVPTDIVASTPDAADDLSVVDQGDRTQIRIGDPGRTFSGQHRYELAYTLPEPRFDELGLDLDIVSPPGDGFPGDQETGVFDVVVVGFELADPFCDVGAFGATGGCVLLPDGDVYRATVEPLPADAGLSIGGRIVGEPPSVPVEAPPIPERRTEPNRLLVALGAALLGVLGAVPVHRWARRSGSNEVFAGGAADAAYGELPAPSVAGEIVPAPAVRLVPDDEMADLATIEFVPPKGLAPWEGAVLLAERVDGSTVEAWLSGLVGVEAVELTERDGHAVIASGPRRGELAPEDATLLDAILSIDDPYVTGEYDAEFAAAWRRIDADLSVRARSSGWWRRFPPGSSAPRIGVALVPVFILFVLVGASVGALLRSWFGAVLVSIAAPALVAFFVYRVLLPARSAQGSALALRAESFRRFLHASEGRHVEWAWSHGVLREYSAWAVALGEADAWSDALERADVPAPARAAAGPIIVHTMASSMASARTAPSSSGSGGGGGFSGGGGSGGGGGGGSSGSW